MFSARCSTSCLLHPNFIRQEMFLPTQWSDWENRPCRNSVIGHIPSSEGNSRSSTLLDDPIFGGNANYYRTNKNKNPPRYRMIVQRSLFWPIPQRVKRSSKKNNFRPHQWNLPKRNFRNTFQGFTQDGIIFLFPWAKIQLHQ